MLNNPSYVVETLIVVALDPPTNFTAEAGQGEVILKWTDPVDKYATVEGETAQDPQQLVAKWSHTLVVRNIDHQPENPDDGTIILMSSVRNQYQTNGYVDNTVENGTPYHYGVFAISTANVTSAGSFTSATPIAGTPLAELAEGTLIKILENGAPVEFYLAKHDYEPSLNGQGRELVVRKDVCISADFGYGSIEFGSTPTYSTSNLDSLANSTYRNLFSQNLLSKIATTSFYVAIDINTLGTLSRSFFVLSNNELGGRETNMEFVEGTTLALASTLRVSNNRQWTRTGDYYTQRARIFDADGSGGTISVTGGGGLKPCFTLPSTAMVDTSLNLIEESA